MAKLRNEAHDIVETGGGLDQSWAERILAIWLNEFPLHRSPEFNIALTTLSTGRWLITIGGSGGLPNQRVRELVDYPPTPGEVKRVSRELVTEFRSQFPAI